MDPMTNSPGRVVIIGASFAGMFAAAALVRAGAEVTLLERDRLPDRIEPRPGVPQGSQPHVLLHRGLLTAERLLPGLEQEIIEAGGLFLDTGEMPWLGAYGWSPTHLPSYEIVSISRPVLEHLVRRRTLEIPGVTLREGFRVNGLRHTGRWEVQGAAGERIVAELVVDASGRGSRLSHWLDEMGCAVGEAETVEARLGYASRRYQGPERPPLDTGLVIVPTTQSPVGATILPVEDRQWLALADGYGDRRPSRDPDEFADFFAGLRDSAAADLLSCLQPLGDVAVYRQTGNRRMPYAQAERWPAGLVVIGDALCAFNPIYGQGMTVAALQAELLGSGIGRLHDERTTRRLQRRLAAVTDLPWSVATSEDLRQLPGGIRQTAVQRLFGWWTERVGRLAVAGDPACAAAFSEIYHLVGSPRQLFAPAVLAAVLRSTIRGVPPPMPRPAALDSIPVPTDRDEDPTGLRQDR